MIRRTTILLALLAAVFAPAAGAQWADPADMRDIAADSIAAPAQEAQAVPAAEEPAPVAEEPAPTVEAAAVEESIIPPARPPVPCNPYEGCNLAAGQTIANGPRPDDICNPYRGCGIVVPAGSVLVNPPRPSIPCGYAKPC